MAAELLVPRRAWHGTTTSRSAPSSAAASARKPPTTWPSRCWRASTPATSTRLSMRALVPAPGRGRTAARQRAARLPRDCACTPSPHGAFVSLPGGTGELVDTLVAGAARRAPCGSRPGSPRSGRAGGYTRRSGRRRRYAAAPCCCACPAYVAGGTAARARHRAWRPLCDADPLRVDGDGGVRLSARPGARTRCTGPASSCPRAERRALLAGTWVTLEVAGARARRATCCCAAFLGGGRDPHRLERHDDEALVRTAREEFAELLGIDREPALHAALPLAAPEPAVRGRAPGARGRARAAPRRCPGLFLAGSGFRAIGIPDCIADGRARRLPIGRPASSSAATPARGVSRARADETGSPHRRSPRPRRRPPRRRHGSVGAAHRRPRRAASRRSDARSSDRATCRPRFRETARDGDAAQEVRRAQIAEVCRQLYAMTRRVARGRRAPGGARRRSRLAAGSVAASADWLAATTASRSASSGWTRTAT